MNKFNEVRDVILSTMAERLDLDGRSLENLKINGRLDEFTAIDSLLMVELVLMLEERFTMRFDPKNIDAELIGDLDRLATFVSEAPLIS